MYISKTKNYSILPLSEVKEDLRVVLTDTTYDAELNRLIKSSIAAIEKRISGDLVLTTNFLEDYNFCGYCYQVNEPNIIVSAITITNNIDTTPTSYSINPSGYSIQKYNQYTLIKFKQSITAQKMNITYNSGYAVLPDDLKRAIIMLTSQYFDIDKSGYVSTNISETKAIDRLLTPYINIIY